MTEYDYDYNEDDELENEFGYESEYITNNDILSILENYSRKDLKELIGNTELQDEIAEQILNKYQYPENGMNIQEACISLAQQLLDGAGIDNLIEEIGEDEI